MNDVRRALANEIAALRVAKMGGSAGVILPEEVLARLNIGEGDTLYVIEEPDGSLRLSRFDADYVITMKIVDEVMEKYRETFTALAK